MAFEWTVPGGYIAAEGWSTIPHRLGVAIIEDATQKDVGGGVHTSCLLLAEPSEHLPRHLQLYMRRDLPPNAMLLPRGRPLLLGACAEVHRGRSAWDGMPPPLLLVAMGTCPPP